MNVSQPPDLLSQLRDIHMPEPISWWPLTPGWFVLAGLVLCAGGIGFFYWHSKRRTTPLMRALMLIEYIQQQQEQDSNYNSLIPLSELIRRVALSRFKRAQVAHLYGHDWLVFLDKTGNTTLFTQGHGQCLADGPYQMHLEVNWQPLFACVKQWVKTVYA